MLIYLILCQDFVFGLSIILRGTINDRLNWAFNLYDLNKDGCITKDVSALLLFAISFIAIVQVINLQSGLCKTICKQLMIVDLKNHAVYIHLLTGLKIQIF